MGETYLDVDVAALRRLAAEVRARSTGLHDAGVELTGLAGIATGTVPIPGVTVGASFALLAAAQAAERAHAGLLCAVRSRTDEIARAMAQAADAYAHHETHQTRVLLQAVGDG